MELFNHSDSSQEFYKMMASRRSIREFSSEQIDQNILINAIKTAGTAPSGANGQPWFFALITSQEIKDQIRKSAESVEEKFYTQKCTANWVNDLKPFGTNATKAYLSEAPALIAVFSKNFNQTETGELKRTYYPIESSGIAVGFLLTALHKAGLATLTHTPKPMHFLNQVLKLDSSYKPFMIVVTGYPKLPLNLPNITRKNIEQFMKEY